MTIKVVSSVHMTVSFLQEYTDCLDQMRDIILATDLAHHFRIVQELKLMADGECWNVEFSLCVCIIANHVGFESH